jgi:hypothetical protein
MFLNSILEVFGSILCRTRNILTEVCHGSPHSFMANFGLNNFEQYS